RAIVRGLAQRYAHDQSRKGRLVAVSLDQMITGTRSLDDFRAALTVILNEVRPARDTLLFLENLAVLAASHKAEAFYAISWLRSALSRGEVRIISVTTPEGYQSAVAGDVIFARHFQPVLVPPLSREETLAVLRHQKSVYEAH